MISFKKYLELNESIHISFPKIFVNGMLINGIDMKFEDWSFDKKNIILPPKENFVGKIGDKYIIYNKPRAEFKDKLNQDELNYFRLKDDWVDYAEFYYDNKIVKPSKYDSYARFSLVS